MICLVQLKASGVFVTLTRLTCVCEWKNAFPKQEEVITGFFPVMWILVWHVYQRQLMFAAKFRVLTVLNPGHMYNQFVITLISVSQAEILIFDSHSTRSLKTKQLLLTWCRRFSSTFELKYQTNIMKIIQLFSLEMFSIFSPTNESSQWHGLWNVQLQKSLCGGENDKHPHENSLCFSTWKTVESAAHPTDVKKRSFMANAYIPEDVWQSPWSLEVFYKSLQFTEHGSCQDCVDRSKRAL